MSDEELRDLQRQAYERDESSLIELFRLLGPMIRRFAFKPLYDPHKVDDIVQETMIAVFKCQPDEFAQKSCVSTFVCGIAANKILNQNRRDRRRRMPGLAAVEEDVQPGPECETKRRERIAWATRLAEPFPKDLEVCRHTSRGLVRDEVIDAHMRRDSPGELEKKVCQAVCRLSQRRHQCIVLQKWVNLSVMDISLTLDIGVQTVKTSLHQARQQLRDDLDESPP